MTGMGAGGNLATIGAGVAPAVVDEGHGDLHGKDEGHGTCLNCGTALVGVFCHACGQDSHVHRTLGSIGHDLLHGAFHFEGRIFRTLPLLVRHPGGLTRRYIAGERARFVSPLALFLFCAFLMFAALHAVEGRHGDAQVPGRLTARAAQVQVTAETAAEAVRERSALAHAEALPTSDPRRAPAIAEAQAALASLAVASRAATAGTEGNVLADVPDRVTGWDPLDHGIVRVRENPSLALYQFQSNAYKYSWALIPISTPFVALLFLWRRRYTLYDHAIFVTYSLDFMLLFATVLSLGIAVGLPSFISGLLFTVVPPVHLFRQLRGAYALRRRSALWRTAALLVFAWVALTTFLMLLLAMGLMG